MGLTNPQTQTIDGHEWTVTPFPARPALKLKVRIGKMIGPAIGELLPALGSFAPDEDKDADPALGLEDKDADPALGLAAIPNVVARLADALDPDEFVDTILELLSSAIRDGTQITPDYFDREFAGNDAELYKAIWFVLRVNYSDFIGMVETALATTGIRRKGSTQTKTQPSTSTPSKE